VTYSPLVNRARQEGYWARAPGALRLLDERPRLRDQSPGVLDELRGAIATDARMVDRALKVSVLIP